jgi:hypothetical protein
VIVCVVVCVMFCVTGLVHPLTQCKPFFEHAGF